MKAFFKSAALALACVALTLASEQNPPPAVKSRQLLKTTTTSIGQSIQYLKTDKPEVTALEVEIPPGGETGWHRHPVLVYGYVLSGKLMVEVRGGKTLQFDSGQAFVESMNTPHNGKNLGVEPVKLLAFFSGEAGKANTVKENAK